MRSEPRPHAPPQVLARFLVIAALFLGLAACAPTPDRLGSRQEVAFTSLLNPIDVPFAVDRARVIVEVNLNSRGAFPFVFDTGLTDSHLLTAETAETLGLELTGEATAFDSAGRRFTMGIARLESLLVGDLRFADEKVAVMSMPLNAATLDEGRSVAGILGDPLVDAFTVTLDFEAQSLRLSRKPARPSAEALVLPLKWTGNMLTTVVEIGGQPARLLVDTGDFHTLTLHADSAERLGIGPLGPDTRRIAVYGAAGPYEMALVPVRDVTLAGRPVGPVMVAVAPRGEGMPRALAGRLGLGMLSGYRAIIDAKSGQLVLEPRQPELIAYPPVRAAALDMHDGT